MTKVGLFYGTQTESTQTEAEVIRKEFGGDSVMELIDVSKSKISDFERFEYIIIGCPTWNVGQLQSDWKTFYDELDDIDFTGKKLLILDLETMLVIPIALSGPVRVLRQSAF